MCPFLLELLLQVHSRAFFLIWQKTKKLVLKQASPWLILLKLNILLEPTTQTMSHGIIPEIEEEVAATRLQPSTRFEPYQESQKRLSVCLAPTWSCLDNLSVA